MTMIRPERVNILWKLPVRSARIVRKYFRNAELAVQLISTTENLRKHRVQNLKNAGNYVFFLK